MEINLTTYGKRYTVETPNEDLSINDYLDIFEGLLHQIGFHPDTIKFGFRDKADDLLDSDNDL